MSAATTVETLYLEYAQWLRGWLRQRVKSPTQPDDIVQDTFFRLVARPPEAFPLAPRAYLATIARRLVVDNARRARIEWAFLEAQRVILNHAAHPGPDETVEAIESLMLVVKALDSLPSRARRAYLLARLEGWSHAEIAVDLGVSKSMIKQYVATGYARCYAALYAPSANVE